MSYYDAYKARLSVTATTDPREYSQNLTSMVISKSFKNSLSYYAVTVTTPSSPYISTTLDSWIVDDPNKTKEVKQIQLIPNQTLNYGDLISWLGDYWLTTSVDYMGGIYYRGSMQKCNSSIKWKDSNNVTIEAYFAVTTATMRGLGIVDGKEIILPDERRFITIQNNADTLKIVKNQRFILDNGRCWKVVSMDSLPTGVINLELQETELSSELDNVGLRICNYYAHSYSIAILNGSTANLSVNNYLPLNVVVKDKGNVVTLPVTYTSMDSSIATVTIDGLVQAKANGNVSVKVALTSDPTVNVTISLTVAAVIVNNYIMDISGGSDSIKVTLSQTITGSVKNNGTIDGSKTIVWSLYGSDGLNPTSLANITSQNGTSCVIKANSVKPYFYGDVVLRATCNQNSSIVGTKTIHIISLI